MFNYEKNLIFWQLLLYGVHIGHRFKNSSLYAGWFIFTYTYQTLIINLYKTILGFKNGNVGYDYCCKVGAPIWFLNLNKAFEIYVNESALKCGEFGYSTFWIHGMISNWRYLAGQIEKLWHFTADAHKAQFGKLDMQYSPWFFSRWSWPRAVLISSVHTSEWPSHECLLAAIPSVGIVDTNISGHISNIATPGNDDSLDAMVYYNTNTSHYILEKKYAAIIGWFHHTRASDRMVKFNQWVLKNFTKNNGDFFKKKVYAIIKTREERMNITDFLGSFINYNANSAKLWGFGVKFFFGVGSGEGEFHGGLDLYSQNGEPEKDWLDLFSIVNTFKRKSLIVCKYMNFYSLNRMWHDKCSAISRRKFMSYKWFKYRFLGNVYLPYEFNDDFRRTNFLVNRFWRNRIYKTYFRRTRYRKNLFAIKFFKFYNVYRFSQKRGFMDMFSNNLNKASSFSMVAFSFGFNYFKKHFYTPLFFTNNPNNLFIKKISTQSKWILFKNQVLNRLSHILRNKLLPSHVRFASMYRVYSILKMKWRVSAAQVFSYYNFYYSFFYFNRDRMRLLRSSRSRKYYRYWKGLISLNKIHYYEDIVRDTLYSTLRFRDLYLKGNSSVTNFINNYLSLNFRAYSLDFRRKFFWRNRKLAHGKIRRIISYRRKTRKLNRKIIKDNYMFIALKDDYKKFKDTKEVKDEVRGYRKKVYKSSGYLVFNKRFRYISSKGLYKMKKKVGLMKALGYLNIVHRGFSKLSRHWNTRYQALRLNFYQASKNYFNERFIPDWTMKDRYYNELLWDIEDDEKNSLISSKFFDLYSTSETYARRKYSLHNIEFFIQAVLDKTDSYWGNESKYLYYEKSFIGKSLGVKNNIKEDILLAKKYIKKNGYGIMNKLRENARLRFRAKRGYKSFVIHEGYNCHSGIVGHKFFYSMASLRAWSLMKKGHFLGKGLYFGLWNIHFNKKFMKLKTNFIKSFVAKDKVIGFNFLPFVRYYGVLNDYFSSMKGFHFDEKLSQKINVLEISSFFKNKKRNFWY